jgi:hypothetical protein
VLESVFRELELELRDGEERGLNFLFEYLNSSVATITCISVTSNVLITRAPPITFAKLDAPPVAPALPPPPSSEIISCADGLLTFTLRYQCPCQCEGANYTVTLSGGSCGEVGVSAEGLVTECSVQNTADLTASMMVCVGTDCASEASKLTNLTCNTGVFDPCVEDSCDFPPGTGGDWGCSLTAEGVVDLLPSGAEGGQARPLTVILDNCDDFNVTTSDPTPTTDCLPGLELILPIILCFVVGLVVGVVISTLFVVCCRH